MSVDSDENEQFVNLFPSDTSIKDFAYPETHPLRDGKYEVTSQDEVDVEYLESEGTFDDEEFGDGEDEDNVYDNDMYYNSSNGGEYIGSYDEDNGEISRKATALFDFQPENDNEVGLVEGQEIWISYRHGQGWLVAEDPHTGANGLVPEDYVEINYNDDIPKPFMPEIFQTNPEKPEDPSESEWVDTEDEDSQFNTLLGNMNNVSLK